jgi:hypothetical protein
MANCISGVIGEERTGSGGRFRTYLRLSKPGLFRFTSSGES